jgi:hypothetical protein
MTLTNACFPRLRALAAEAICHIIAGNPDMMMLTRYLDLKYEETRSSSNPMG